jgi:hypothetical protein
MNVWVDKWDDVRFSLNDLYMVGLMTGWMFFFMGFFTLHMWKTIGGLLVVVLFFMAIRGQWFIDETQYLRGMIPHHSMAIMMSKHVKQKPNHLRNLLNNIIKGQYDEIEYMKMVLQA